jgi:hypothetical protein
MFSQCLLKLTAFADVGSYSEIVPLCEMCQPSMASFKISCLILLSNSLTICVQACPYLHLPAWVNLSLAKVGLHMTHFGDS